MDNQNNRNSNRNNQNDNKNNKPNRQGVSFVLLIALITTFLVLSLYQFQKTSSAEEITYDKFLNMIKHHKVQEVTISSDKIMIKAKKEKARLQRRNIIPELWMIIPFPNDCMRQVLNMNRRYRIRLR